MTLQARALALWRTFPPGIWIVFGLAVVGVLVALSFIGQGGAP